MSEDHTPLAPRDGSSYLNRQLSSYASNNAHAFLDCIVGGCRCMSCEIKRENAAAISQATRFTRRNG